MAITDDHNSAVTPGTGVNPPAEPVTAPAPDAEQQNPSPDSEIRGIKLRSNPRRYVDVPQKKSPRTAIIIAALIIAVIGIGVGAAVFLSNRSTPSEPAAPATVTVSDSELGTVELTPPTDASVNTYEAKNLSLDDSGYYTYTVDGVKVSEMGVDLSYAQGEVDFAAVKESGIDFVMLRIGGRGYGSGVLYTDEMFTDNFRRAKEAGLKIGVYFFSQAISRDEAVEEAQYILGILGTEKLDYPIAVDWEYIDDDEARTDNVTGEQLTAAVSAFCDTVRQAGYRSAVYANSALVLQSYDFNIMKNYDFWLADYRDLPEQDAMYYHYTIWQYADDGEVPGIDGPVDLNLCLNASAG